MTELAHPPINAPPRPPALAAGEGHAALLLGLQATLLSHARLEDAATAFAIELAESLGCERVAIGMADGGTTRLLATSQAHTIDPRSTAAAMLEAAMNEAFDQGATLIHPPPPAALPLITLAHQRLVTAGGAACSIPLVCAGRIAGAITLERAATPFAVREIALCEDAASFAGPLLLLKRDAVRPWWRRLGRALQTRAALLREPGHAGARLAAAAVVAALVAATLLPLDYRVSAPARLEGSVQRVIAAPADGFLQRANVRAGDSVRAGQVLAELAGEDLQLEQRRRASELRQHENAYKGAMARADRGQMVIHQARAGEAQAMLELIEGQLLRAQIVAPFDGVVIKGDLTQNLGAPVTRGEVLLTLSPADSFRLIVEVDEADIGPIRPGQSGRLVLAASPDQSLELKVLRVIPMAASAAARNYFEVEAALDTRGQALRPGLRGVAKIDAGTHSMLWMLTHRALNWLRLAWWSLSP